MNSEPQFTPKPPEAIFEPVPAAPPKTAPVKPMTNHEIIEHFRSKYTPKELRETVAHLERKGNLTAPELTTLTLMRKAVKRNGS